jgi:outer membrane protein, heavy metal efflux system
MRLLLLSLLGAALAAGAAVASEPTDTRQLTLEDAITLAQRSNPAVLAARVDVEAAETARRGAAAPPRNPELSVGAGARLSAEGPSADVGVGLSIPLDLGGSARHRRLRETAALDAARDRLRSTELQVAVETRVAFAGAHAAELRVALAEQAVELSGEIERAARRRHELGEVSVLEPNSASLDRAGAEARRSGAHGERAQAMQRLQAVLGLRASEVIALVPEEAPPWPGDLPTDDDALVAQAVQARSDLAAAQEGERAAAANLAAARASGVPPVTVGAAWEREGNEATVVGGGVTFEIPLQRNQVGLARAQGTAGRAGIEARSLALQVERDVRGALAQWRAAADGHRLTTGEALELAEANLRLVVRSYETGEEELIVLLMMQRQAIAARAAAIEAELALHLATARLEQALGELVFAEEVGRQ